MDGSIPTNVRMTTEGAMTSPSTHQPCIAQFSAFLCAEWIRYGSLKRTVSY